MSTEDLLIKALCAVRLYKDYPWIRPDTESYYEPPLGSTSLYLSQFFDESPTVGQSREITLTHVTFTHYAIDDGSVYLFCYNFPDIDGWPLPDIPGGLMIFRYEMGNKRDKIYATLCQKSPCLPPLDTIPSDLQRRFGKPEVGNSTKRASRR